AHSSRVEGLGLGEGRAVDQRYLIAEMAVAEVWPIADLAVAHPHDVDQPVATHVRQLYALLRVAEYDRWALALVEGLCYALGCVEALLRAGPVPDKGVIFGNQ